MTVKNTNEKEPVCSECFFEKSVIFVIICELNKL